MHKLIKKFQRQKGGADREADEGSAPIVLDMYRRVLSFRGEADEGVEEIAAAAAATAGKGNKGKGKGKGKEEEKKRDAGEVAVVPLGEDETLGQLIRRP